MPGSLAAEAASRSESPNRPTRKSACASATSAAVTFLGGQERRASAVLSLINDSRALTVTRTSYGASLRRDAYATAAAEAAPGVNDGAFPALQNAINVLNTSRRNRNFSACMETSLFALML